MTDRLHRKHRTTTVPLGLVYDRRVSHLGLRLWLHLDALAAGGDVPMPTRRDLAADFECSADTIDRGTASLVEAGWLEKTPTSGGANIYATLLVQGNPGGSRISAAPPSADLPRGRTDAAPPAMPVRASKILSSPPPGAGGVRPDHRHDAEIESAFDRAWTTYPRRIERKAALKAWTATVRRCGLSVIAQLELATGNYARAMTGKEPQYMKHGATFYGPNEPWRDWITSSAPERREQVTVGHPSFVPESLR